MLGRARDHLLSDGFGWLAGPGLAHAGPDVINPVQRDSTAGDSTNARLRSEDTANDTANHLNDADPSLQDAQAAIKPTSAAVATRRIGWGRVGAA